MKKILVASFDMEIGGVERSLISMLKNFDYENYKVDLMLYSHTGDFINQIPKEVTLLEESKRYKTFRQTITSTLKNGYILLAAARILAKNKANKQKSSESGYKQMQYMWKYSLPYLPNCEKKYDVAISYLWPHYFIAEKVQATTKIAWIHTDFSSVEIDEKLDIEMWDKFDCIIAVSEECKNAFTKKYPILRKKVKVLENIISPSIIRSLSLEIVENPMLSDKRFKLLTVARLSHAKGIDNAVRVLKLLKDKGYYNIAWYVVGYGGDEKLIRNLINEYELKDSFFLLGKKINPYPYIKAADLYVQPSRYEGKAVTVIEAQILAKPVLITNFPTSKSQVIEGVNGIIGGISINEFTQKIEILHNDKKTLNKLSLNCSNQNFDNSTELIKLYNLFVNN